MKWLIELVSPPGFEPGTKQIMSPNRDNELEEEKALNPANSSNVLQNPQPKRNKIQERHDQ
jgi:hypothetical protein